MDLYQEVTNRIMEQLENGIIPWEKPWISAGNAVSHATGKPYSLLNQMLLGRPGEYVTFKQCQAEGGKVRKGEKSSMANAKEKGRRIGRPQTTKDDIPAIFYKHYPALIAGTMNVSELARVCGLSRPTVYKYLKLV